ncbi:MAG: hypothetical protein PHH00_03750 [Candidatus Nanoarchaeia archaeon]|nr:hypothetical protein [Candidatus Nanoarchaeia archaeon]
MAETPVFLQNTIFTRFLLPLVLVWFVVFAILEKTKLLGENKQIHAIVSLVMGLIFVAAFNYSSVVNNIVLFAVIAVIVVFVGLLIWTFMSGEGGFGLGGEGGNKTLRIVLLIGLFIAVAVGVIWAFGIPLSTVGSSLFSQAWSQPFWTNLVFIILIGVALALVLRGATGGKGK